MINMIPISVSVVPHAGTWIEIPTYSLLTIFQSSFPTRERGLKFETLVIVKSVYDVVPHAGTWIEIYETSQ